MVLGELGTRVNEALQRVAGRTVIGQEDVDEMLKHICHSLVAADVQVKLVAAMRQRMKEKIEQAYSVPGTSKQKILRQVVLEELTALIDPQQGGAGGEPIANRTYKPTKNRPNVIMFVGLQGAGKTTTVAKLARHYKQRGWKVGLVCADTFRAGAGPQLLGLGKAIKVPVYSDCLCSDPVVVAQQGVELFKKEGFEIIIVDTSGRHMQESALFEEMEQLVMSVNPDHITYVLDGTIGQMAYDQVKAFKQRVSIGSIIVTKLDGHGKGGGALSAVAAAGCPITHTGVGEHMDDLEPFEPSRFINKMLGLGDIPGLIEAMKTTTGTKASDAGSRLLTGGGFTLRDLYEQFANVLKMGPVNKLIGMIPGMDKLLQLAEGKADPSKKLRTYMVIMDSMTDQELDDPDVLKKSNPHSRVCRIARGSGCSIADVNELLAQYRAFTHRPGKPRGRGCPAPPKGQGMTQLANMIPPSMMKQIGGIQGIQEMMKSMGSGGRGWPQ